MIDSKNISDLQPTLQRGAKELIRRMEALGYPVGVSSTYRDNEYQNYLYAQGRTRPGQIVTNAKGGESIHNYGLAFDIFKNVKGQEYSDPKFFETAGKIWQEMGGEWGGSWKSFPDRPHMQFTNGLTLKQLQGGAKMPNVKMKWENTTSTVVPPKEGDNLKVSDITVLYKDNPVVVQGVFKDDTNYVKLRDLEKFGLKVSYDEAKKLPVVTN